MSCQETMYHPIPSRRDTLTFCFRGTYRESCFEVLCRFRMAEGCYKETI